jgi:hypothetical protein
MTVDELRGYLYYLIEKYAPEEDVLRRRLLLMVDRDEVPAKGILIELTQFTVGKLSEEERKVIGNIALYFC